MNCVTFKAVAQDLDREGVIEETMREDALSHSESCLRCARRLHDVRALSAAFESLARADDSKNAPPWIENRVVMAFRAQAQRTVRRSRLTWTFAAAAALALTLGAGLLWHRTVAFNSTGSRRVAQGSSQPAMTYAAAGSMAAERRAQPQGVKPKPSRQAPTGHHLRHRPVEHTPAAPRPPEVLPSQEMADFLPLPFADREEPLGAGAIVRIQLSEGSLGLLGVPVSDPTSSQPVTADVMLGQDGTARAIRFVSGPVPSGLSQQLQSIAF